MAERDCPHNSGVVCDGRAVCTHCGFYPPEEKRRLAMVRAGRLKVGASGKHCLHLKKKGGAVNG